MDKKAVQSELSSYIGKLFRDNFGKGPSAVFVSVEEPFVTIYLKDFLAPMERVLVGQKNDQKVDETRDLLMQELIPDIKANFRAVAGIEIEDLYYDWSLSHRTGMLIGVLDTEISGEQTIQDHKGKEALHQEVQKVSQQAEKAPESIRSFELNDRTLIVERKGILVPIEKEMLRLGFSDQLRITKRHLEKRLLHLASFEQILGTKLEDIFVDWDLVRDKSYIVLIKKPRDS
ncbi:DUF2294 family protein [Halobacillus fulvus]|nr:DUF2294 family protein [Halobacillus fulvus]